MTRYDIGLRVLEDHLDAILSEFIFYEDSVFFISIFDVRQNFVV